MPTTERLQISGLTTISTRGRMIRLTHVVCRTLRLTRGRLARRSRQMLESPWHSSLTKEHLEIVEGNTVERTQPFRRFSVRYAGRCQIARIELDGTPFWASWRNS